MLIKLFKRLIRKMALMLKGTNIRLHSVMNSYNLEALCRDINVCVYIHTHTQKHTHMYI